MTDVLASEWLKLRSARSTQWILVSVMGLLALCGFWALYVAHYWDGLSSTRHASFRAAPAEHPLVLAMPFCMGVLGALAITPEYTTGTIRSSLAAVPRRTLFFGAKATAVTTTALSIALLSLIPAYFIGRMVVGDRPIADLRTPVSQELPWLLSVALSAMVISAIGLGFGTLLRSTAGAVTAICALLFVLPALAQLLPAPWNDRAASVLPPDLAEQLSGKTGSVLPPSVALATLVAYAALPLAAAIWVLRRRDV